MAASSAATATRSAAAGMRALAVRGSPNRAARSPVPAARSARCGVHDSAWRKGTRLGTPVPARVLPCPRPGALEERSEDVPYELPSGADTVLSAKYRAVRARFLHEFWHSGMVAEHVSGSRVKFADQTIHLGFAMLAFAAESRLLVKAGLPADATEDLVAGLLDGFAEVEGQGEETIYGTQTPGFFVRDHVHDGRPPEVEPARHGLAQDTFDSDSESTLLGEEGPHFPAMSLDQVVHLMVGWWAISSWSSRAANVARAREQARHVMRFLANGGFEIVLPTGGHIPKARGPDCRAAAGFLCAIAERIPGAAPSSPQVGLDLKSSPVRMRDDLLGELSIPGFEIPLTAPVSITHALILPVAASLAMAADGQGVPIRIPVLELVPGYAGPIVHRGLTPCPHVVPAHPTGHNVTIPCVHPPVPEHPDGHPTRIPCAHPSVVHPGGDETTIPCVHMKPKHRRHEIGRTPCPHMVVKHAGGHRQWGVWYPCTHMTAAHPDGHVIYGRCAHLIPTHPEGDKILTPCVHTTVAHPDGHVETVPCLHLTSPHPGGHTEAVPCLHLTAEHPDGHPPEIEISLAQVTLEWEAPMSGYVRNLILLCMAFEPKVPKPVVEHLGRASNHTLALLLRSIAQSEPLGSASEMSIADHDAAPLDGPSEDPAKGRWSKSNTWIRCTEPAADAASATRYNGLDFLSLECMMRMAGASR